jgi:hypothetical protein
MVSTRYSLERAMHLFKIHCRSALQEIERQGRYRWFVPLSCQAARYPPIT